MKETAPDAIAFRPSTRQEVLEIERRTGIEDRPLPVRNLVQRHPFGDSPPANADFGIRFALMKRS